jgi:hypothetical protein
LSPASTGPTRRTRYAEAFWWVVPIPVGLVVGVVALVQHPSLPGAGGLVALAVVGILLEVVVWRHLRRRWAGETTTHPMDVPQPLRSPIEVGVLLALLIGAITWKAVGLGQSWVAGLLTGLGLLAFYLVAWLIQRSVEQ